MISEEDYIQLNKYLAGELSDKELSDFSNQLNNSKELQQELNWHKETQEFLIRDQGRKKLKDTLKTLQTNAQSQEIMTVKSRKLFIRRSLIITAVAATILLLLNPFTQEDLYEKYSQPAPLSLTNKSDSVSNASLAESAFNSKNYSTAFKQLNLYLNAYPDDIHATLYLGIAATYIGKYQRAEEVLNKVREGKNMSAESGTWYLALMHVKKNEIMKARELLEGIPIDTYWGESAENLLEDLSH